MNFPFGIIGVGLSTVALTKLSKSYASRDKGNFSNIVHWATKITALSGIPSMIGLALLASPILVTLFLRGNFTEFDVTMTSKSLGMFSLGLPAFMLVKVFASALYAQKDYKTPVKVGLVAIVVNIILNLIFIKPLAHAGLALSTSLAGYVNAVLLLIFLRKTEVYQRYENWGNFFVKIFIAALSVVGWLYISSPDYDTWISLSSFEMISRLFYLIFSSMLIYFLILYICGFRYIDIKGEIENL